MFFGSYEHVLDDKGRTSLPKDFRDELAKLGETGEPVITALPRCLVILTPQAFAGWQAQLTGERGRLDDAAQRIRRLILGQAAACRIDRQGRISIPGHLLAHAGIDKEIVFMGVGDEIEVWDPSRHKSEINDASAHYRDDSREVLTREP